MSNIQLTPDLRSGLQEVANVAVAQAAENISRSFSARVQRPIPNIHLIEAVDVTMTLGAIESADQVTAVTQAFYGAGISGEAVLLFTDASMDQLAELMLDQAAGDDRQQAELVLEMASLLNGSCIHGICNQLDLGVMLKHPVLFGQHKLVSDLLGKDKLPWQKTLAIELNYTFQGLAITCDLLVLFHEDSLASLFDKLSYLID
jgi:chemotaxis protein CheY-P-specific phosphatase CheC